VLEKEINYGLYGGLGRLDVCQQNVNMDRFFGLLRREACISRDSLQLRLEETARSEGRPDWFVLW
jgi:hypothetical protein